MRLDMRPVGKAGRVAQRLQMRDVAVDDVSLHVQGLRLLDDQPERPVRVGVGPAGLDGDLDLLADVARLFGVGRRGLGHLHLVVLELAAHHCYGAASSPMLRRGQGWPQRRRGGCKQQRCH